MTINPKKVTGHIMVMTGGGLVGYFTMNVLVTFVIILLLQIGVELIISSSHD